MAFDSKYIGSPVGLEDAVGNQINPATEETLAALAGLVDVDYDSATVTYTDTTKEFIDSIVFKMGVTTVRTITVTYPTTTSEVYTKS